MMGNPVTEDLYSIFSKEKEHEEKEKESQRGAQEQVSLLLQTYMQLLLPDDEKFHGGWALINCDLRSVCSCQGSSWPISEMSNTTKDNCDSNDDLNDIISHLLSKTLQNLALNCLKK